MKSEITFIAFALVVLILAHYVAWDYQPQVQINRLEKRIKKIEEILEI